MVSCSWVGKRGAVLPSSTSTSVGKRHKLAQETCTQVGHVRMEGGREGGGMWEGKRARALGKEGWGEGEGGAGDVGQPGQQGGRSGHALRGHGQRPREEWVGVAWQLLNHLLLQVLPRPLLGLTVRLNLHTHHMQAGVLISWSVCQKVSNQLINCRLCLLFSSPLVFQGRCPRSSPSSGTAYTREHLQPDIKAIGR